MAVARRIQDKAARPGGKNPWGVRTADLAVVSEFDMSHSHGSQACALSARHQSVLLESHPRVNGAGCFELVLHVPP